MFPFHRQLIVTSLIWVSSTCSSSLLQGNDSTVRFDVPSLLGVREIQVDPVHDLDCSQKIIEVVLPVTTEVAASDRSNVNEFRFDIFWNRNVYPIVDYGPKTQTTSSIEGLISVDRTKTRNAGVGISAGSGYRDLADANAKADLGMQSSLRTSYQEIPQHEVLVASGTIKRGTGAFFRFHPSRTEILEGGRDLVVAFQVPQSWRGGVLQIECRATGHRKVFGAWKETFEFGRAFVLPIYLEGDDQARRAATEFVRSEQKLRLKWQDHQRRKPATTRSLSGLFPTELTLFQDGEKSNIPDDWVHYLIQSGDAYFEHYHERLPIDVANAAGGFVQARSDLLKMGR